MWCNERLFRKVAAAPPWPALQFAASVLIMTQENASPIPSSLSEVDAETPREQLSCLQLFIAFSKLALLGFGGVLPQAYHQIVETRKWLKPAEFAELLVFCQIMPGPTICTLSLVFGHRHQKVRGALSSLAGMLFFPLVIISVLGVLYQQHNDIALVRQAITGMSVVAAGLISAMGLKILIGLPRTSFTLAVVGASLVGVGIMRYPMLAVLVILGPTAVYVQWRKDRKHG
jgi:chromate transporter